MPATTPLPRPTPEAVIAMYEALYGPPPVPAAPPTKLWLVERTDRPGWSECIGAVIRAADEDAARRIAAAALGPVDVWRDPALIRCTPITADGPAGIILDSYTTA